MKRLLAYLLAMSVTFAVFSRLSADSEEVRLRHDNSQFDLLLPDNGAVMTDFLSESATDTILPDDSHPEANLLPSSTPDHRFALKTNMLYDLVLVPNIGLAFYAGKNVSLWMEWMYSWWAKNDIHRYWRIYGGHLGARWWFSRKTATHPLTGHHLGLYGGIFIFDFEWGKIGYMGGKPGGTLWDRFMVNAGIEYGYSLRAGKRFSIDFAIGIGYVAGNYIKYFPFDNSYYREKEYKLRYFGPSKAEISLVWILGSSNTDKKKGGEE